MHKCRNVVATPSPPLIVIPLFSLTRSGKMHSPNTISEGENGSLVLQLLQSNIGVLFIYFYFYSGRTNVKWIPKNSQPNENSLTASTREIKVIQEQKYILESAIFYKAKKAGQRPQHSSSEKPQCKLQTCSFSDHNRRMGSLNTFKFVDIPLMANKINCSSQCDLPENIGKAFPTDLRSEPV